MALRFLRQISIYRSSAHTTRSSTRMHLSLSRPHGIYTGWMGRVLTSVLPFALIVSYPTSILFGGVTLSVVLHQVAATIGIFLFMLWLWRRGLRAYTSASS